MLRDLSGKVAWVTGAGSGIGEAAAVALGNAGMEVVLSGRREKELRRVAEVVGEGAGRGHVEALDVSEAASVEEVVGRIGKQFGRLDVLVHSAGLNRKSRHWVDTEVEDWDTVINVDLNGAFYCCRAVLPMMRVQQDGLIVNISSWAGRQPSLLAGAAYSAAKHGMNALTETINMEECVNGIRACAVCPGEVATPILKERPIPLTDEELAKMLQPEDLGEIILMLARLPKHVCVNDLLISPTWNRGYVGRRQGAGL